MTGNTVSRRRLLDGRRLGGATRHGKGAARMETAAWRRRQGARDLALDRDALALVVGMRWQRRGKQRLGIGMQRLVAKFERVGQFDDLSEVHDRDAAGDMSHGPEVVAGE